MGKLRERDEINGAMSQKLDALDVIARHEEKKQEKAVEERTPAKKLVTFFAPQKEYDEMKRWFGANGLTVSAGVRMCIDYVRFLDKSEKIVFTSSGIHENELAKLR